MRKYFVALLYCYCAMVQSVEYENKNKLNKNSEHKYYTYGYGYGLDGIIFIIPYIMGEIGLQSRYASIHLRGGYGVAFGWFELELSADNIVFENFSVFVDSGRISIVQIGSFSYYGVGVEIRKAKNKYYRFEMAKYDQVIDRTGQEVNDDIARVYPRISFGYRF